MNKFKEFEEAYSALKRAKRTLDAIPFWCITDVGVETFSVSKRDIRSDIDIGISSLSAWFEGNFPKNLIEAYRSEDFSFKEFFDILRQHPELAKNNEEKLKQLLRNLWGADLPSEIFKEIPNITELIPE